MTLTISQFAVREPAGVDCLGNCTRCGRLCTSTAGSCQCCYQAQPLPYKKVEAPVYLPGVQIILPPDETLLGGEFTVGARDDVPPER